MGAFTCRDTEQPQLGQMQPRTVHDLGSPLIALIGQGAGTVLSSAATQRRQNEANASSRGVRVVVKLVKTSGTIDVVLTVQSYDKATGEYIDRLASVSLTASGVTEYIVHPELTAVNNSIAKNFIGEEWRVKVVSGVGSSPLFDLTIGACLLP